LKNTLILCGLAFVFLILGNNTVSLTNPDEVFYSGSAKEMVQQGTWLVPHIFGQPQFEKPILLFWLLRVSFLAFGPTSFGARFPPSFFGLLGCLTLYYFCLTAYRDRNKSFLCAYVLLSSGLYLAMSRFLFTDMVFSVFILMSLTAFYTGYLRAEKKRAGMVLFGVCSALAVLTKGLLGIVLPLGAVLLFLALRRNIRFVFARSSLYGLVLFLILASPWYAFMLDRYGASFVHEFFYNDHIRRILEAEHRSNDTWYFYPMTLVVGMLPWSVALVAALAGMIKRLARGMAEPLHTFLISWVVAMFVILQCAHSKLISYILPAIPALAVITGDYVYDLVARKQWKMFYLLLGVSSLLIAGLPLAVVLAATGMIASPLEYRECLPDKSSVIALLALSTAMVGGSFLFARTRRHTLSVCMLGLQLPALVIFCFLSRDRFENDVSSKQVGAYLLQHDDLNNAVLCSKNMVRGVRYYTDKDVAVIGGQFFSPHPIPIVNTDQEIRDFLTAQNTTYAIVGPAQFKKLKQVSEKTFEFTELLHVGSTFVVKVSVGPAP